MGYQNSFSPSPRPPTSHLLVVISSLFYTQWPKSKRKHITHKLVDVRSGKTDRKSL